MEFNDLFSSGYEPTSHLPYAPRVAAGTLAHKIYHRSPEHATVTLRDGLDDWTFKVQTDKHLPSSVSVSLKCDSAPARIDGVKVWMPEIRVDRFDRFVCSPSSIGLNISFLNVTEIDILKDIIRVANLLAVELNAERDFALAEELFRRQAEWDAGASERHAQKEWNRARNDWYKTIADIFADLKGETVRLSSLNHRYRSTGVVSVVGDRSVELKLPRGSRGQVKTGYWNLVDLEYERDGKFVPIALPMRPTAPDKVA